MLITFCTLNYCRNSINIICLLIKTCISCASYIVYLILSKDTTVTLSEPSPLHHSWRLSILSRAKINIGDTNVPAALIAQHTVVVFPLSRLVIASTCFCPLSPTIRAGLWHIVIPVSSMLKIFVGLNL